MLSLFFKNQFEKNGQRRDMRHVRAVGGALCRSLNWYMTLSIVKTGKFKLPKKRP